MTPKTNPKRTRKRRKKMKIKTALNSYAIDGSIFQYLPMYGTATPLQMGVAYVLQHSGEKTAHNIVKQYCDTDGHLTDTGLDIISNIIVTMFKDAWDRKYEALVADYKPLENYNMIEHEEGDDAHQWGDKTDETTYGAQKRTEKRGARGGSRTQGAQENSSEQGISAFNSSGYSNDRNGSENLGSRQDGYSDQAYTDEIGSQGYKDTTVHGADDDASNFKRDLTRHGNIGVTTSQQMLESELNIRAYRFFEKMFEDIDSVLALRVYEDDEELDGKATPTQTEDAVITQLANGIRISVLSGTSVVQSVDIPDGTTPEFNLTNSGDLYVKD